MKQALFLLITTLFISSIYAQEEKSMVLSFGQGKVTTPDDDNNKWGKFYNIDLDYYLTKRQVLTSGFGFGSHRYFRPSATGTSIGNDGTNTKREYYTFSIVYKYKFLNQKSFSASIGAGAAILTEINSYPQKYFNANGSSSERTMESAVADLVFPVRLDVEYKLTKRVRVGAYGGVYVQPDYPIMAYQACLKVGILLK